MAIEIIPKAKVKEVPWAKITLYLCLALLLIFLLSYFVLDFYQKRLTKELSGLKTELARTKEEKKLEEEVLSWEKKIEDFGVLLEGHQLPTKVFEFLEKNTHPKIWFFKFNLDSENNMVNLSGQTDNFEILSQQIFILQKEEMIKNINLSAISIDKQGKVEFGLQLTFDPKIFK